MSKHVLGFSGSTGSGREVIECEDKEQDIFKRSEFYVQICQKNREKAARQTSQLLETAEILCKEDSTNSQRKGKVFKKLAPQIEKHVFDELQKDICVNLWAEAVERVYGTTTH